MLRTGALAALLVLAATAVASAESAFVASSPIVEGRPLRVGDRVDVLRVGLAGMTATMADNVRVVAVKSREGVPGAEVDVDATVAAILARIDANGVRLRRIAGEPTSEDVEAERERLRAAERERRELAGILRAAIGRGESALTATLRKAAIKALPATWDLFGGEATATENYVLLRRPDAAGWRDLLPVAEANADMRRGTSLVRVYLEESPRSPWNRDVMVSGSKGLLLPFDLVDGPPDNRLGPFRHDGPHVKLSPGGFTAVRTDSNESVTLRVTSPGHLPAEIVVPPSPGGVGVVGDVMLRRPPPERRADVVVVVRGRDGKPDRRQLWFGTEVVEWPYGYRTRLGQPGKPVVDGFFGVAAQRFEIGFATHAGSASRTDYFDRRVIEPRPGGTTLYVFSIAAGAGPGAPSVAFAPFESEADSSPITNGKGP